MTREPSSRKPTTPSGESDLPEGGRFATHGPRREPLPWSRPKDVEDDPEARERLRAIMESPSYVRADLDTDFLARDEMRAVRLQLEYYKPDHLMDEHEIRSTIVVFGGTRLVEPQEARRKVEVARDALTRNPDDEQLQRRLVTAERILAKSHYYDEARKFGRIVSREGRRTPGMEFVIVTGGGPGIMEAANRGAFDEDTISVGLNITLPHEQFPNPYITPELCFQFRYFALRKMHFLKRARALVAFPGGYGTFDEIFETLMLIQTRKIEPLPVVLVGEEFWRRAFDAPYLAEEGVIDPEDVELFTYAETAEQAWEHVVGWYRRQGQPIANPAPGGGGRS
jgi:uncharacterized protein (TIGR00730 family)